MSIQQIIFCCNPACKCSTKLFRISAHCRDCFNIQEYNQPRLYGVLLDPYNELSEDDIKLLKQENPDLVEDTTDDFDGYVPSNIGIGCGDDVELVICFHCGQIQNWKPIEQQVFDDLFSMSNNRNYSNTVQSVKKRNF